ncbi:hypothetical protein [Rhizobium sp. BK176]|uniref:hypothetical protein n=1 Tax=Rhizobium sp. BK176 TaxID=2587071 RepID=UPI002168EED6|nr:hypothetical protein [Rhizobium sp. BK176]MCS4088868.1 hypothetical protein [Rhizobium sp. BK176]
MELDIPELSPSEFTIGSRTGLDRVTYFRDGSHWAFFDGCLGDATPHTPLSRLSNSLMETLSSRIGASHFFDEGALRIKPSDIILKTPNPAYILSSQRDSIIDRLSGYVEGNFADVGGNLAVRVHEPSLTLLIWKHRSKAEPSYLSIQLADHRPWQTNQFSAGLHVPIDRGRELIALARSLITPDDDLSVNVNLDELELMTESSEEMSERSLIALADDIVGHRTAEQVNSNQALAIISEMAAKPMINITDADYANLIEAMHAFHPKLKQEERLMLRLAEDQWNDRPLNAPEISRLPAAGRSP